jgi:arylformamidase
MLAQITIKGQEYTANLAKPLDISIPLSNTEQNPLAWYLERPVIEPVKTDDWTGKVSEGADVNFNNILFNPHAHGTHTECVGHIASEVYSVNNALTNFFFLAEVITVAPEKQGEDRVILEKQISEAVKGKTPEALVIRTLPNSTDKRSRNFNHTNWPYLSQAAAKFIHDSGIDHLLIDLPSVDKEKDGGKLLAHRAFWNYPEAPRMHATITEFIFVAESIQDGSYLLNLQIAPFQNDASPSKPVLYKFE